MTIFILNMNNLRIKSILFIFEPEYISTIGFDVLIPEYRNLPNSVKHKHEDGQTFIPY